MTLPASGAISLSDVNIELGRSATTLISLNDAAVRTLAGKPSGTISLNDLHGKSNTPAGFSYVAGPNSFNAIGTPQTQMMIGVGGGIANDLLIMAAVTRGNVQQQTFSCAGWTQRYNYYQPSSNINFNILTKLHSGSESSTYFFPVNSGTFTGAGTLTVFRSSDGNPNVIPTASTANTTGIDTTVNTSTTTISGTGPLSYIMHGAAAASGITCSVPAGYTQLANFATTGGYAVTVFIAYQTNTTGLATTSTYSSTTNTTNVGVQVTFAS